jgi:hypothetical protein
MMRGEKLRFYIPTTTTTTTKQKTQHHFAFLASAAELTASGIIFCQILTAAVIC